MPPDSFRSLEASAQVRTEAPPPPKADEQQPNGQESRVKSARRAGPANSSAMRVRSIGSKDASRSTTTSRRWRVTNECLCFLKRHLKPRRRRHPPGKWEPRKWALRAACWQCSWRPVQTLVHLYTVVLTV